jgi:sphinganine C4-monooxygenase
MIVGLVPSERAVLFILSVIKTLDDHSGYRFPWDPIILLGKMTGSDIIYHTIHHQPWGIKVFLICHIC